MRTAYCLHCSHTAKTDMKPFICKTWEALYQVITADTLHWMGGAPVQTHLEAILFQKLHILVNYILQICKDGALNTYISFKCFTISI